SPTLTLCQSSHLTPLLCFAVLCVNYTIAKHQSLLFSIVVGVQPMASLIMSGVLSKNGSDQQVLSFLEEMNSSSSVIKSNQDSGLCPPMNARVPSIFFAAAERGG